MKLEDDSTHFQCAACNKINVIKDGHITKVAHSLFDKSTQKEFSYRPYWVMLCDKCYTTKEKKKKPKSPKNRVVKKGVQSRKKKV